jgi:immune inhibitor A
MKTTLRRVPPAPDVMVRLYMDYKNSGFKGSFKKYLESIGFTDPADDQIGMDDAALVKRTHLHAPPLFISIPSTRITGRLRVKVLLVDFSDRVGTTPAKNYEDLLFSKKKYPSGSMHDFYTEVSLGKVDITGSVHGWLRMPQPYSFYTNKNSGTEEDDYPNNAQRLAEDAVAEALNRNVPFESDLDKLGQGVVTALFIIHAGRGAEEMPRETAGDHIWSHKWVMVNPVTINPNLQASIYLTVPHNCKVGVCAHELGHLAFQWEDFYDPDFENDGAEWDGSGSWDLMAGGSWNNGGQTPAHPTGLHKMQHGWITTEKVKASKTLTLKPFTAKSAKAVKITSAAFRPSQYLLLENRTRKGFDFHLPGEGLLVWRVDERFDQNGVASPALLLIQADGKHNLEDPDDWNEGDAGDPFPGKAKVTTLSESGKISTSFGRSKSGISLSNIKRNPETGVITLKVSVKKK